MAGRAQTTAPRVRHGRTTAPAAALAPLAPRRPARPRYAALDERGAAWLRANYRRAGIAGSALALARYLRRPVSRRQVERWAHALGVTRRHDRWDGLADVQLGDMSANQPVAKVAAALHRTTTAVSKRMAREGIRQSSTGYTAAALAEAVGVSEATVRRWIAAGALKAERRHTERTAAQGGDLWLITERDAGRFLRDHAADCYPRDGQGVTVERWAWALALVAGAK